MTVYRLLRFYANLTQKYSKKIQTRPLYFHSDGKAHCCSCSTVYWQQKKKDV